MTTAVGQILVIKLMTQALTPSEVGKFYLLSSISSWFVTLLSTPTLRYVTTKFHTWKKSGSARHHLTQFSILILLISGVSLIGGAIGQTWIESFSVAMPLSVGLYVLGLSSFTGSAEMLNVIGRSKLFLVFINGEVILRLISVFLIKYMPAQSGEYLFFIQSLFRTLIGFIATGYLFSSVTASPTHAQEKHAFPMRSLWAFFLPLSISTVLSWLQSEGYRIAIVKSTSDYNLGIFAANMSLVVGLFTVFDTLFYQLITTKYWSLVGQQTPGEIRNAFRYYAFRLWPALAVYTVGAIIILPFIQPLLLNEKFNVPRGFLAVAAFSEALRIAGVPLYYYLVSAEKTKLLIIPSIIGAISVIPLVFILAPANPIYGPAFAVGISYLLHLVSTLIITKRFYYK